MTKRSLHIGVNVTDRTQYPEPFEELYACVNDAVALEELARAAGFEPARLHDEAATASGVKAALETTAKASSPGDLVFVTYSGHGSQGPDVDYDEPDGADETWVLYDRQLLDDELWQAWSVFPEDTRIFLVSDSCHSGTVARAALQLTREVVVLSDRDEVAGELRSRRMPPKARARDLTDRKELYEKVKGALPPRDAIDVRASVLLFAACQDTEDAHEKDDQGVMTRAFLRAWDDGRFQGTHLEFFDEICRQVRGQTPNYLPLGRESSEFERSRPLT
jgi:hypothetical protein